MKLCRRLHQRRGREPQPTQALHGRSDRNVGIVAGSA